MTNSEYKKFINNLSKGLYDILKTKNLIGELDEKNQNNPEFFSGNLSKIASKELRWVRGDYDLIHDILLEAFSNIMLQRNPFAKYVGKGKDGHKSPLEPFIHVMFQREVSKLSQKYIKRLKEVKEGDLNGFGDMSPKDQFDNLLDKYDERVEEQFNQEEEVAFEKIMKDFEEVIKERQSFKTLKLIIDMLLSGFSKSEVAKTLGVSSARVSKYVNMIKQGLDKLANRYAEEGDDTLLDFLEKYKLKASFPSIRNPEKDFEVLIDQLVKAKIDVSILKDKIKE